LHVISYWRNKVRGTGSSVASIGNKARSEDDWGSSQSTAMTSVTGSMASVSRSVTRGIGSIMNGIEYNDNLRFTLYYK
jgi:hypothetical protein